MSKWSAIQALGEMGKGAGSYFGMLYSEKIRAERLAEARAGQVADREDNRAYQEAQEADRRAYQESRTAEARAYQEARLKEARTYQQEIKAEDRAYAEEQATENLALKEASSAPSSGGDMNATEKTLAMRATNGRQAVATLRGLIDSGKYDPSSATAYGESVANNISLGRLFTSEESKVWDAAADAAVAAILRTDTGAAAPTEEQVRYTNRLVPRTGDGDAIKQWKLSVLDATFNAMDAASAPGATQESIRAAGLNAARVFESSNPMPGSNVFPPSTIPADAEVDAFLQSLRIR